MVDSHLNAIDDEIEPKIRRIIDPEMSAKTPSKPSRNISAPCGGCAKWRAACKGAQQKE
jgi:hypothetical protein